METNIVIVQIPSNCKSEQQHKPQNHIYYYCWLTLSTSGRTGLRVHSLWRQNTCNLYNNQNFLHMLINYFLLRAMHPNLIFKIILLHAMCTL